LGEILGQGGEIVYIQKEKRRKFQELANEAAEEERKEEEMKLKKEINQER